MFNLISAFRASIAWPGLITANLSKYYYFVALYLEQANWLLPAPMTDFDKVFDKADLAV